MHLRHWSEDTSLPEEWRFQVFQSTEKRPLMADLIQRLFGEHHLPGSIEVLIEGVCLNAFHEIPVVCDADALQLSHDFVNVAIPLSIVM